MRSGFSLLELSIVLVIIGLLAGGVMTGQSLIRAAELRAATTEYTRFTTALNAFRDKYQAIPGDMKTGTAFWGKDNTNCTGDTGTAATPGTCNGNGDGRMTAGAGASATGEMFQFWKQLALAGMIEGSYTGLSGANGALEGVIGTSVPASKVANAGWGASTIDNFAGDGTYFKFDYGNNLTFGAYLYGNLPISAVLKPEEAWNIDTKLDDGKPGLGKVVALNWTTCSTAASNSDTAATYRLTSTTSVCALYFTKSF